MPDFDDMTPDRLAEYWENCARELDDEVAQMYLRMDRARKMAESYRQAVTRIRENS